MPSRSPPTNEKHRVQALVAIAAGKPVLGEKPLAPTAARAREMVAAAACAGRIFAADRHFRNAVARSPRRDLWAGGRIGTASAAGGMSPGIAVPDADTIRFHWGEDPQEVAAMVDRSGTGRGVGDPVMSLWSMPSGAMVTAPESAPHRFAGTSVDRHGTEASIRARGPLTQRPVDAPETVTAAGRGSLPAAPRNLYELDERAVRLGAEAARADARTRVDHGA
jgi:1,5-anhydro-D-fructose reductase (1,5-anhydro-D-mannitol-forming)